MTARLPGFEPYQVPYPTLMLASLGKAIGLGFGAGLSPVAPGTVGSLAALALYYVIYVILTGFPAADSHLLDEVVLALLILVGLPLGVWATGLLVTDGEPDPGRAVWDEYAGMWITGTTPRRLGHHGRRRGSRTLRDGPAERRNPGLAALVCRGNARLSRGFSKLPYPHPWIVYSRDFSVFPATRLSSYSSFRRMPESRTALQLSEIRHNAPRTPAQDRNDELIRQQRITTETDHAIRRNSGPTRP